MVQKAAIDIDRQEFAAPETCLTPDQGIQLIQEIWKYALARGPNRFHMGDQYPNELFFPTVPIGISNVPRE